MTPETEKSIRERAGQLIDAEYVDPQVVLHGALDRHALLIEVDMLRAALTFMIDNCEVVTDATAQSANLPLKQEMVLAGLLAIMQENCDKRQAEADAAIADRQAMEELKPEQFFEIREQPNAEIREEPNDVIG